MSLWLSISLLALMLCLILLLSLLSWKLLKSNQQTMLSLNESHEKSQALAMQVISKSLGLLASQDALTFQGIQAMDQSLVFPTSAESTSDQEVDDEDLEPLGEAEWDRLYATHLEGGVMSDHDRRRFELATFGRI